MFVRSVFGRFSCRSKSNRRIGSLSSSLVVFVFCLLFLCFCVCVLCFCAFVPLLICFFVFLCLFLLFLCFLLLSLCFFVSLLCLCVCAFVFVFVFVYLFDVVFWGASRNQVARRFSAEFVRVRMRVRARACACACAGVGLGCNGIVRQDESHARCMCADVCVACMCCHQARVVCEPNDGLCFWAVCVLRFANQEQTEQDQEKGVDFSATV